MPCYRLDLEYLGAGYSGWQRQPGGIPTVQQTVEEALARMLGRPVRLAAASRTDAGVHALAQVASFEVDLDLPAAGLRRGLNGLLPPDVAVTRALAVPAGFDPRRQTRGKSYRYLLRPARERRAFADRHAWRVPADLDLEAMQAAAAHLVGRHDFSAFGDADGDAEHGVRVVQQAALEPREGGLWVFTVAATAFLKHMVRSLAGTLVEVGRGRFPPDHVAALLASRDRAGAGPTAPPQGLWLVRMELPEEWGGPAPAAALAADPLLPPDLVPGAPG